MSAWLALFQTPLGWSTSLNSTPSPAAACAFTRVRLCRQRSPVWALNGIGRASRSAVLRRSRSNDPDKVILIKEHGMQRYGMVIGIKPEMVAAYKRLHAAIWPAVSAQISRSHIRNSIISLREPENLLFSYFEYHGDDFAGDMAAMAANPDTQRLWAVCMPCQ